jgi:hypothetical protein
VEMPAMRENQDAEAWEFREAFDYVLIRSP